jgi:acetylornithine deacetylase
MVPPLIATALRPATNLENRVHKEIERHCSHYVELLQRLVRVPSYTGHEGECQALVRATMEELELFDREVHASNQPPFRDTGRSYQERPNIVGRLPGEGGVQGRDFILNAHVDTTPVEDPNSWTHPPFAAVIEDGKLYGRGAVDDKAGIAMMLLVADSLRRAGVRLPGNLILESVIEDEDSGNGTLACTQAGYSCEAAIVLDGTWPFRCIDSHLGQLWLTVEVKGVPAAACIHRRGTNPLDGVFEVVQALRDKIDCLNQSVPQWYNIEAPYFVNVGRVQSGVWAGSVPEKATLEVQIGYPPPSTAQAMIEELHALLGGLNCASRLSTSIGALCIDPFSRRDNPLVQTVRHTVQRLRPGEMEFLNVAVTGHCDLRNLRRPDGSHADAVLYGPGGGHNPHIPDEHYVLDTMVPVAQNVASTIMAWYGLR